MLCDSLKKLTRYTHVNHTADIPKKFFLNGTGGDKSLITVFPSNWFSMCRLCKQQGRIIDSKNIYVKRFQCFFLKIFDIFLYFYTRPVFVKVIGTDNCLAIHIFNKYSIARARVAHVYARQYKRKNTTKNPRRREGSVKSDYSSSHSVPPGFIISLGSK